MVRMHTGDKALDRLIDEANAERVAKLLGNEDPQFIAWCAKRLIKQKKKPVHPIGWVYGIRAGALVKIGKSVQRPVVVISRYMTHNTSCVPEWFYLSSDCHSEEKQLHRALHEEKTSGEWFRLDEIESRGLTDALLPHPILPDVGREALRCDIEETYRLYPNLRKDLFILREELP